MTDAITSMIPIWNQIGAGDEFLDRFQERWEEALIELNFQDLILRTDEEKWDQIIFEDEITQEK